MYFCYLSSGENIDHTLGFICLPVEFLFFVAFPDKIWDRRSVTSCECKRDVCILVPHEFPLLEKKKKGGGRFWKSNKLGDVTSEEA